MITPMERLRDMVEREARGPAIKHGDELTHEGLRTLILGDTPENLSGALLNFWTDVDHGLPVGDVLMKIAVLRTAEVALPPAREQSLSLIATEALDRAFAAMWRQPNVLLDLLGSAPTRTFGEALVSQAHVTCQRLASVTTVDVSWIVIANSVVALWPDLFVAAFDPLLTPSVTTWRGTTQYLAALAYTTPDHPEARDSIPLWSRFGTSDGVRWSPSSIESLSAALHDDRIRALLHDITSLTKGDPQYEHVITLVEEITSLQLDTDLPKRRAVLLAKLREVNPAHFWDDEVGLR